jgi:hypothetical protein
MKEAIKSFLNNDIVKRALKTFIQAFLATLSVSIVTVQDFPTLKAVVVGAIAAGISAVWNSLVSKKQ